MMQISPSSDRFIPSRLHSPSTMPAPTTNYQHFIGRNLFGSQSDNGNIYAGYTGEDCFFKSSPNRNFNVKQCTQIGSPVKILDIPGFRDDFYVNTVEWSEDGPLAIALSNEAYVYTPDNLLEVCKAPFSSYVSALKFGNSSSLLTVALSSGSVQIYDLTKPALVRSLSHHSQRVCALTYLNGSLLTGGKDGKIFQCDLRMRESVIAKWDSHKGEVVALKEKCRQGESAFVSGGNDGMAALWDIRKGLVKALKGHSGAVKAISWCSWKSGLLATGGGCNDKTVKLWNVYEQITPVTHVMHSQVTSLQFNRHTHSLLSSHGYSSGELNQWSIGESTHLKLQKKANAQAHRGRVLSLGQNSDGSMIFTAGSDEMLKIWELGSADKRSGGDEGVFGMRKLR